MTVDSYGKLVGLVVISVAGHSWLFGWSTGNFALSGLLVTTLWGIPAIIVIALYRHFEKRNHDRWTK